MIKMVDLMRIADMCKENEIISADGGSIHMRAKAFKEFEDQNKALEFNFRVLNDIDSSLPLMYREIMFYGLHIFTTLYESELKDIYGLTWEEARNYD